MTTLLLAEHDNKTLAPTVAKAMSAARALGEDVDDAHHRLRKVGVSLAHAETYGFS